MAEPIRSKPLARVPHAFSNAHGARVEDIIPGGREVRVKQVHSARVLAVTEPFADPLPEADGLVTDCPGLVLSIVTADCAPVLLADEDAGVIGAVHAGWRGAVAGIAPHAVARMEELGADRSRIRAAIGPCIAQKSYEVDAPFRDQFSADADRFFERKDTAHWLFDLPGFVAASLAEAGVEAEILPHDTYTERAGKAYRFHSYRRATHHGEATGGRQLSMIALPMP